MVQHSLYRPNTATNSLHCLMPKQLNATAVFCRTQQPYTPRDWLQKELTQLYALRCMCILFPFLLSGCWSCQHNEMLCTMPGLKDYTHESC